MDHSAVASLPHTRLLDALDSRARDVLAHASSALHVRQNEIVIEAGQSVDCLYVVESGLLHAEVPGQDGELLAVAHFGAGDFFGELSFLRSDVAAATVRASTDATLIAIPHRTLGKVAERHPAVMRELAIVVARRLNSTNAQLRRLRVGRAVGCLLGETPAADAVFQAVCRSVVQHLEGPMVVIDLDGSIRMPDARHFASLDESLLDRAHLPEHDAFTADRRSEVAIVAKHEAGPIDEAALAGLISDYAERYELVLVVAKVTSPQLLDLLDCTDERVYFRDAKGQSDPAPDMAGGFDTIAIAHTPPPRLNHKSDFAPIHTVVIDPGADVRGTSTGGASQSVGWVARHLLRRKVGLALGAGGSKGYAHVGVVEGLHSAGIPIDYIAGSSVGAPIAWAVAGGMTTQNIHDVLHDTFRRALRPGFPLKGLLTTHWVRKDLERFVKDTGFGSLSIPLAIVAVDLARREEVVFTSGNLVTAMLASTAIPGLFPPVRWRGRMLVDGGLLNPIPSSVVHDLGADIVIGVKLTNPIETDLRPETRHTFLPPAPPIIDTIQAAIETLQWKIVHDGGAHSDVTIEPVFHEPTGLHDYTRGDHFVAAGRDAVGAAARELKALLPWAKL